MPWIFNLPGGVVRQYPSQQEDPENGMSFQEAEARVRREINPRLVNTEDPSSDPGFRDRSPWAQDSLRNAAEARQFFRDMGDQFSGGIADIGTAVGQMVNIFDPTASGARGRGDVPIGDRMANASREWGQEQMASLSPEMLHDQNDPDWLNPGNVAATMGRSAPSLIPTLVGGALSGGSITVPAIIEGTMGGGSVADTIDESIRDVAAFDPEMFINSPLGQQALAETDGDYPRAVELAANRAKGAAPVLAGAITAGLSRLGENVFRAGQGPARRTVSSIVARIALGGAREGLEETLQSTQEQVAGNLAIGQIDGRSMWEGADQAAIMGGIAGAGMGATMGGVDVALSNMRRRGGGSGTGPAQVQGPVMPPPGHPNRGPAEGDGNPPGWTAPNVDNAEDADYTEPGENIIEDQRPRQKPKGWRRGTESWADLPPENSAGSGPNDQAAPRQDQAGASDETSAREAELRAQDAANSGDPEDTLDSDFDEEYASSLQQRFEELGRARKTKPDEDLDTSNAASVSVVPLFKYNREDIETSDEDALAVYRGAQMEERPISDTATFQAYSALDNDTFASEDGDPADAVGFGLKVVDADGNVSYYDIGAQTAEEAARYATPQQAPTERPNDNSTLTEELNTNNDNVSEPSNVEIEEPQSRDVVATGRVQNLKPAANEALNSYRTKGEQGLQEYLGGLNVTATRSLLRNLGGQGVRGDSIAQTRGKIVQRVRQMAKSSDARGLPAPEAPTARMEATKVTDPVQEQEVAPPVAPEATPRRAHERETPLVLSQEERARREKKPIPTKVSKPQTDTPERIKPDNTVERISHRSPAQIKAALREVSSLEDDAYDAAVAKLKITPEEAAAVREAMKTDNGLDNLRPVFNDALRAGKNTKKSKQTEEAPKAEPKKKAAPKEEKESPARVRKERDAGDRAMAESLSRGQPKDYDVVRRSVEQWLEVERDRIGARSDASWYKQWPISRQEALIQRTWNAVNGHGGAMASRGPDAGSGGAGQALEGEVILPNRAVAPSQQGGSVPSVVGALEPMIPAMRAAQADIRRVLGDEEYFAPRQPIDVDALEPNRRAVARAAVALEEFVAQNRALRAEQAARALPDGGAAGGGNRVPAWEDAQSPVEAGLLTREQNSIYRDLSYHDNFTVEEVPLASLVRQHELDPTNRTGEWYQARGGGAAAAPSQLPLVARVNGRLLLMDGHHRALSEAGPNIRVRIYDVDRITNPPAGMRAVQDPQYGEWRVEPIPDAPNADKMASRDYGKGKVSGDLNPLQMFSRAERMARTFPEESSTRMHMLKWLEKRVRKAELKFIDMSEFLHGGPTGNALRDKATRQELVDYITSRKLRLTVRYAYGQPGNTYSYKDRFNADGGLERDVDDAAKFAGFTQQTDEDGAGDLGLYYEYTLLGGDVIKHNYLEVGIVIEPSQPGSEFTGSHVGGKGAVAGMLISDYPIEVDGKQLNAMAVHQGQSDYHDADASDYLDMSNDAKRKAKEITRLQAEIRAKWPEGRPLEFRSSGFDNDGPATITVSNPQDMPGDEMLSSAIGVGGRGLNEDVLALVRQLEALGSTKYNARDINAPYRDTHPELMFRTAFMLAVSSDHDALVWPTADTIRMYEGHSTYKGSFYDERWPKYAESWLREYGAKVTKQGAEYKGENPDLTTVEEFVDETMRDEARDIANDLIPTGVETNVEASFGDALDQLGYVLSESHRAWQQGLDMKGREGDPSRPNRFDIKFYEKAEADVKRAALAFLKENTSYHDELFNDEKSPSERDVKRVFTDFAETYLNRFIDVLEEGYDKERGASSNAEVYVMKITPEMKEAFRETGIPMFSQGNAGEKPIQADDNPIPNKAWVNEMERAIKAAAACAAGQAAAGAAFGALATGAALGAAGAVPIANLIAAEGDSLRWMTDFRQRQQQEKIDAGLAPANDYVDENGNYRPPQTDEEGYVLPPIPVAGGGRPLRPARPYTQAELAAAEREIRSLAPRATITPENVSRQADIRRYGLRNGSGAPDDAPPRE